MDVRERHTYTYPARGQAVVVGVVVVSDFDVAIRYDDDASALKVVIFCVYFANVNNMVLEEVLERCRGNDSKAYVFANGDLGTFFNRINRLLQPLAG